MQRSFWESALPLCCFTCRKLIFGAESAAQFFKSAAADFKNCSAVFKNCSAVFQICSAVSEICTCRMCCRARDLHRAGFKSARAGLELVCAGIRSARRLIVLSQTHPQGRPFRDPSCLHFSAEGCASGGGVADHMLPDSPTCEKPDGQAFTTLQMLRLGVDIGICYIDGWPDHAARVASCLA